MSARELTVLISMCFVWGLHFVVIKTAVSEIPPIFYAAVRMSLVAALLSPFLRWRPGRMARIISGGVCLGALNYAFMFTGVKLATASAAAVAMELYVPFATILSMLFLGDRVGWPRLFGIAFAFAGVAIIALGKPDHAGPDAHIGLGVASVAAGAFSEAIGAVMVKKSTSFKPHEILAWFALVGAVALWLLTAVLETRQIEAVAGSNKLFIGAAVIYSAVGASIFGHTAYYWLLQRLPVSLVSPSMLLTTLLAVMFGVALLGEPFGPRMMIGGAMTLAGVGVVLLRSARKQDKNAVMTEPPG